MIQVPCLLWAGILTPTVKARSVESVLNCKSFGNSVGACMQQKGRGEICFISTISLFFFSFSRTIRTSGRELIDSPINSPMDALILLSAKQPGGHIKYGQCAEHLDWVFYDGRISQQIVTSSSFFFFLNVCFSKIIVLCSDEPQHRRKYFVK